MQWAPSLILWLLLLPILNTLTLLILSFFMNFFTPNAIEGKVMSLRYQLKQDWNLGLKTNSEPWSSIFQT